MGHDRDVYTCPICNLQNWDSNGQCSSGCKPVDVTFVAQEGGSHYQAQYQHWDWVADIDMGYLPGNATKYISRWRKKNGVADLKKAMTYIDKMIALLKVKGYYTFTQPFCEKTKKLTDKFVQVNELGTQEGAICRILAFSNGHLSLKNAKEILQELITTATEAQEQAKATALALALQSPSTPLLDKNKGVFGGAGATTGGGVAVATSTGACINHPSPFGYQEEQE